MQNSSKNIMLLIEARKQFRNPETDKIIELMFGKPDFNQSVIDEDDRVLTPIAGKKALLRID